MPLTMLEMLALAAQCAPAVAPETLLSLVQVESRFDPLAIGVNGKPRAVVAAATPQEAAAKASALIAAGRSVDLGLAQINSENLSWLGLTVESAFDSCHNLAAAARVLQAGYQPEAVEPQRALRTALSRYNTGGARRGFVNGYVAKVYRAAAEVIPAIRSQRAGPPIAVAAVKPPAPAWDVFGQVGEPTFVIHVSLAAYGGSQ